MLRSDDGGGAWEEIGEVGGAAAGGGRPPRQLGRLASHEGKLYLVGGQLALNI